jgi:hypothetical protein
MLGSLAGSSHGSNMSSGPVMAQMPSNNVNTAMQCLMPPFTSPHLAQMHLAAVMEEVQARARAQAQVAQLMQIMELNSQHNQTMPSPLQASADEIQNLISSGMAFRMAAGQIPEVATTDFLPVTNGLLPKPVSSSQFAASGAAVGFAGLSSNPAPSIGSSSISGSPTVDLRSKAKKDPPNKNKLKARETLRTYLQQLRCEDPRCIFIVRRINKLGFRSKMLLERHYSQYGEVKQVCVAHSKVKPLPNSGTLPRTRPGNFGLVVMRSPNVLRRILDEGVVQTISGVEVHVHRFEQLQMEKEAIAEDQGDCHYELEFGSALNETKQTSSNGSSGGEASNEKLDAVEGWNRQDTGSSEGSGSGPQTNPADQMAPSVLDWRRGRCAKQAEQQLLLQAQDSRPLAQPVSSSFLGAAAEAAEAYAAAQPPYPSDVLPGNYAQLQQLAHLSRSLSTAQQDVRLHNSGLTGQLSAVIKKLAELAADAQQLKSYSAEPSSQAAALARWAQQNLSRLQDECQQKISELTLLSSGGPPSSTPLPPPAPGLVPSDATIAALLAASTGLQSRQAPATPGAWFPSAPTPPPALQVSPQVQQYIASLQALVESGAGLITPPLQMPAAPGLTPPATRGFVVAQEPGRISSQPMVLPGYTNSVATPSFEGAAAMTNISCEPIYAATRGGARGKRQDEVEHSPTSEQSSATKSQLRNGREDEHHETLRLHLTALCNEDPNRIFVTRRINKLGFRSKEVIWQHFAKFGEVDQVLVAHSKVKPFRDNSGQLRTRPGGLGIVVMHDSAAVKHILSLGEEQVIAGHQIRIHMFERPKVDGEGSSGSNSGASSSTADTKGPRSAGRFDGTGSSGSGGQQSKSEEETTSDNSCGSG